MCAYTLPVFAFTKDETVYSKINSQGEVYQTIVSTHLQNSDELELINDMSDLINIENTNGEEEFTQDGNSLVWKADKKDIYYQGESQKDLPIECNIKYELDGKEITAEEIAGKTGHVKITIQYVNKEEHIVSINGKNQKMYTPFVAVAGTILQNDTNKNIEVSNGKVINDGSKAMIMGIALPGLQESLNVSKSDIDIPNDIEITMDSTDFEIGNIITFVTPKILEEEDLSFFDELDKIYSQVNTLQTASNQIQEGSQSLADGTSQLVSGTEELKEGTNTAYNGAKQIQTEVIKATNQLANDQSDALDQNTLDAIGEQAKQSANLSDTQKEQIGTQAEMLAKQTIQSQKTAIGEEAATQAVSEIEKQTTQIGNKAASQVAGLTLTQDQKQKIETNVKTSLEANSSYQALPVEQQAIILQFSQKSAISAAETIAQQTAKQVASQTAQATATQIAEQVASSTAQSVAEKVAGSVANTTAQTVAQTTANQTAQTAATTTAKEVANQVKSAAQSQVATQMSTLGEGLNQLTNGLSSLNDGTATLQSGATQLNEGANTLAEGIKTFNEDGIKKICNYINGDIKDISERVEKLTELSKEYNNFTMLNGDNDGNVKFIMIMDAIKKQENNDNSKEEAVISTQKYDSEENK
jgi:putative membrane protein